MTYCAEHGIAHSRFLEEWTDQDRAKLMAYLIDKSQRCGMCGTAEREWREDRFAYTPVVETCLGCQQKDLMREEANTPGATIVLVPKAQAARLRENDDRKLGVRVPRGR